MKNSFHQLKQQFRALGTQLDSQTLHTAKRSLQEWLEANSDKVIARKPSGEFNGTMMQWFHWYTPADGNHWNKLKAEVKNLAEVGITGLWLPPAHKGAGGGYDVGYGIYDLFDLGEFDQKGSVRTKYGTKDEYIAAVKAARDAGIQVYADVVFNQKMGAGRGEAYPTLRGTSLNIFRVDRSHKIINAKQLFGKSCRWFSLPNTANS